MATVGTYTVGSRILGFVRDLLTASYLGVGPAMDALAVALKIPSFLRRLLAEGAFSATFLPMFAGLTSIGKEDEARSFAEDVLSLFTLILIGIVVLMEFILPWVLPFFAPGFSATPERLQMAIDFTRVTFPFILFISLSALFSGILNSFDRFAAVASSCMAGNFVIIAIILTLMPVFGDSPGTVLAFSITACGVVQLLWVYIPCRRMGINLRFKRPRLTPNIRKLFKNMGPVALGSGVYQINVLIGSMIASFLPVGGVSLLYYAERLNQLPLSVIGVAMSTVLLPTLSKQLKRGDAGAARKTQNDGIQFALLLIIPASIALFILAEPFVKIVFQRQAFSAQAAHLTAQALQVLVLGLPAYVLSKIFTTSFYAQGDTKTPLIVGALSVVVDIILSLLLIKPLAHVGIAAATAAAAWVNVSLLGIQLYKNNLSPVNAKLKAFIPRLGLCSTLTALILLLLRSGTSSFMGDGVLLRFTLLITLIGGGLVSFVFFARMTGALNSQELKEHFKST